MRSACGLHTNASLRQALLLLCATIALGQEEPEVQPLRERLTEREDETRVEEPWTFTFFNRPLSVTGQYEVALEYFDRLALGDPAKRYGQVLLDQELEIEAFYPFSKSLSFFAQVRVAIEEDLDPATPDGVSDIFVERGEMWLYWKNIAGSNFSLDAGRLNFEDDRRWWWDEELDALRIVYEADDFEIALAAANEVASSRFDRSFVEAERNDIFRIIAELSWDWRPNHALQFFALWHDDYSSSERLERVFQRGREDESDAELFWLGLRAAGGSEFHRKGALAYWLDAGAVVGDERLVGIEELPSGRSRVVEVENREVSGWAVDAGFTYFLPAPGDPRVTAGYAVGSGDGNQGDGTDHSFRQTGLHTNEPGYGGVQRFQGYGRLLEPELSNLGIATLGLGCSVLRASSIDLVFHDYRLLERTDSLRNARLETELTGKHREIGQSVDLVLGIEEWERLEFEVSASALRGGRAFGSEKGEWILGGFVAGRVAF